jgi:putative redox protein
MAATVVVRSVAGETYTQEVETGGHRLVADEPVSVGGADRGPGPYEYLLAGLGACISMTLRMYAGRKGMALEGVEVRLSHRRVHARDCEDCESAGSMLDEIESEVRLRGDLDDAERARLMQIATRCPVHRTLASEVVLRTTEAPS